MIRVHNLQKQFEKTHVINGISFTVNPGEIVAFLGKNGAGKTTTMRMIAGFLKPTSGEISVCDISTEKDIVSVKSHIGYLPEGNPLAKEMDVYEYILFHAGLKKVDNPVEETKKVIKKTQLTDKAGEKIEHLSKGYRQRVGLAAALVANPSVLLLDEPLSGLDPSQKIEIRNLIKEISKDKAILISTHILPEVVELCDKALLLHNGSIVFSGTIEELKKKHVHSHVRIEFNIPARKAKEKIEKIADVAHVNIEGNELIIAPVEEREISEKLFDCAIENDWKIHTMYKEPVSLEAIFNNLTK